MTTAHRPTWVAAKGQSSEGQWDSGGAISGMRSSKDSSSHKELKVRRGRQVIDRFKGEEEAKEKLGVLREVEERFRKGGKSEITERPAAGAGAGGMLAIEGGRSEGGGLNDSERAKLMKFNEGDETGGFSGESDDGSDGDGKDDSSSSESDSDSDDSDDDEDEESKLQAELTKIKTERKEAKQKEDAQDLQEKNIRDTEAALLGNPLLAENNGGGGSGKMKRRWNDDIVFRNQSRTEPTQTGKRYINDTVRNDFHKKFMGKYMR